VVLVALKTARVFDRFREPRSRRIRTVTALGTMGVELITAPIAIIITTVNEPA
jgi:hypothetical protein